MDTMRTMTRVEGNKFEIGEYVTKPKRSILDVLCDFYHCKPTLSDLVNFIIPWMKPRQYSIANSCWHGQALADATKGGWAATPLQL